MIAVIYALDGSRPQLYSIGLPAMTSAMAIPMYSNRKKQIMVCWLSILLTFMWIAYFIYDSYFVTGDSMMRYPLYAMLPVVCIILIFLAIKGIKHDEELIRSTDRIR